MATPVVDLRVSRVLFIFPVVFTTGLVALVSTVIIKGWADGTAEGASFLVGDALMVTLFLVLPIVVIAWHARSSVRSFGTTLRVRSGFITRMIPAEDIDGFVVVDRVGRRLDFLPDRRFIISERPAMALRPGSPSFMSDQWSNRGELARRLRRTLNYLGNRWGPDLPIPCVPAGSRRRIERAITQLEAWHRWALR